MDTGNHKITLLINICIPLNHFSLTLIEGMENRGLRPLESILMQVGGWPMTLDREEWNEDDHSWQSIEHEYFHLTGSYVFYKIQHLRSDYFDMDAVLVRYLI